MLLCRSKVIFLEGGPVVTAGNYPKKSRLCPSLERKLRRARSLAMCTYSSKRRWFLDAAVAQIAACFSHPPLFPLPGSAVCCLQSSGAAAGEPDRAQCLPAGEIPLPVALPGGRACPKEGKRPAFPISAHGRWQARSQVCPCVFSLPSRGSWGAGGGRC